MPGPNSGQSSVGGDRTDMSGLDASERTPLLAAPSATNDPTVSPAKRQPLVIPTGPMGAFSKGDGIPPVTKARSGDTTPVGTTTTPGVLSLSDARSQEICKIGSSIIVEAEVAADEETEFEFHGGITKKRFWIIFSGILIANFVAAADSTIMASTHTSITSAFHSSNSASWLSTSYLLTSTSFQPLYGRVSDTIGRRIPFVFACLVFSVATIWCAAAQSMGSFIAARAVCGIGAGGMLTMGAIVLSDVLPIEIRATYQSINNLAYGTGAALGAGLGGFLADTLGWRWEFGIQVPLGLFCMIVSIFTVPGPSAFGKRREGDTWARLKRFDIAGSFFMTTTVACLVLGMNLGGNIYPWGHPIVITSLVMGAILGRLLIRAEAIAKEPVMPLEIIWSSPRRNLMFNNFCTTATVSTLFFNLPLYFQTVLLSTATTAGSRLLLPSLALTMAAVATGFIINRTGRIYPAILIGSTLLVIGSILLTCLHRSLPSWSYFFFLVPGTLGAGFIFPSSLMGVLITSSQEDQAVATSTLILWRSLGNIIGVACSSLVVQNLLLFFLERRVTGPHKAEIINRVRRRVDAIFELPKEAQEQVIGSYASSLRFTFAWGILASSVGLFLIYRIQLPTIRSGAQSLERGSRGNDDIDKKPDGEGEPLYGATT